MEKNHKKISPISFEMEKNAKINSQTYQFEKIYPYFIKKKENHNFSINYFKSLKKSLQMAYH